MSSLRQIEANRLNSRNSTGPRSAEGKAASSMNALKSGIDAQANIIRGEDAADLQALAGLYHQDCQPATAQEWFCVDILIRNHWQLRRMERADAELWEYQLEGRSRDMPAVTSVAPTIPAPQPSPASSAARTTSSALPSWPARNCASSRPNAAPIHPRNPLKQKQLPPKLASFLKPWGRRPRLRRTPWSGPPNLLIRNSFTRKLASFRNLPRRHPTNPVFSNPPTCGHVEDSHKRVKNV